MSVDAPPANEPMEHQYNNPDDLFHYQQAYPNSADYNLGSNHNHSSQDHWDATHSFPFPETIPPSAALEHSHQQWVTNGIDEQQCWSFSAQWQASSLPQVAPIPFEPWPEHKPILPMQPVRIPETVQIPEATKNVILPQRGRPRAPIHHSRPLTLGDNIENALGEFALARSARPGKYRNSQEVNADNRHSLRSGSSVALSSRDRSKDPT
jgi:hypothetical protein